ncbi:MAG: diaminopimelate decarboxylase [Pseudomonadota bacterium]
MTGFHEKDGILNVDDIPLTKIAEAIGTPTYIYSANHIEAQFAKLSTAMQKHLPADKQPLLCYACKANSNLAVLSLLRSLGSGLEIVSHGELLRGLKSGFDPAKIVSTGVGKGEAEIKDFIESGIHQINVESLPELMRIDQISKSLGKDIAVVFRLNPDIGGGSHDKNTTGRKHDKFGISPDKIFEGFNLAKDMPHVNAVGLSMHIGSQVSEVPIFKDAFEKFAQLVKDLRAEGHEISRLDIGGGFPIKYDDENLLDLDAYAEWVNDIIVPLDVEIVMEPGRFLVGNAGALLTRTSFVKVAEERNYLILDAAMNDLIRPTLYDAYHSIEAVENRNTPKTTYDVVGPICETGDTFATQRELTEMKEGDLVIIRSAGAYGFCMSSNYNTRGRPAEVLVKGDQFEIIRPRESLEEIFENEKVPSWIK